MLILRGREIVEDPEKALEGLKAKTVSRRSLLTVGAAASAAAVAGVAAPSLAGVAFAAGEGRQMTIRTENVTITLNVLPAPSATFFITIGNITQVDGMGASGLFYCRGVFTNPGALDLPPLNPVTPAVAGLTFVEQRFRIDGQGTIIGSGDEGDLPLAVLGGTGRFTGVHGSYTADAGLPIPVGAGIINYTFSLRRG
jgi:hypothetical protein